MGIVLTNVGGHRPVHDIKGFVKLVLDRGVGQHLVGEHGLPAQVPLGDLLVIGAVTEPGAQHLPKSNKNPASPAAHGSSFPGAVRLPVLLARDSTGSQELQNHHSWTWTGTSQSPLHRAAVRSPVSAEVTAGPSVKPVQR